MSDLKHLLLRNIEQVYLQVADAAAAVGRDPSEITIIAVTKYVDVEITRTFAGCLKEFVERQSNGAKVDFRPQLGESRAQLLSTKVAQWGTTLSFDTSSTGEASSKDSSAEADVDLDNRLPPAPEVDWHFIGPLQSNKISQVVPIVSLLQSVDRFSLLRKLNQFCSQQDRQIDVLLEFNVSGEANKHGFTANDIDELLEIIAESKFIRPTGLMGMGGLESDLQQRQREFESLAALRAEVCSRLAEPQQATFQTLSMGMSGDLKQAIAAGSTMVRIGSSFFEGVR